MLGCNSVLLREVGLNHGLIIRSGGEYLIWLQTNFNLHRIWLDLWSRNPLTLFHISRRLHISKLLACFRSRLSWFLVGRLIISLILYYILVLFIVGSSAFVNWIIWYNWHVDHFLSSSSASLTRHWEFRLYF